MKRQNSRNRKSESVVVRASVERLEERWLLSAQPVSSGQTLRGEFTAGVNVAFATDNSLTVENLNGGPESTYTYSLGPWTQEFSLTSGSGNTATNVVAFYNGNNGELSAYNLQGANPQNSDGISAPQTYNVGPATQIYTVASVLGLFDGGTLSTVDVGTGRQATYDIGPFSQEFTTGGSFFTFYNGDKESLKTINAITGAEETYSVGTANQIYNTPSALAFYNGTSLYWLNFGTSGASQVQTTTLSPFTQEFTISNTLCFYSSNSGQLTVVNLTSGTPLQTLTVGSATQEYATSSALAFYNQGILTCVNVGNSDVDAPIPIGVYSLAVPISTSNYVNFYDAKTGILTSVYLPGGSATTANIGTVTSEFIIGTTLMFYDATKLKLRWFNESGSSPMPQKILSFNNFAQEFTISAGASPTQTYALFYANSGSSSSTVTTVNLGTSDQASNTFSFTSLQEYTAGTDLALYDGASLTWINVASNGTAGTANMDTTGSVGIGSFSTEFALLPASGTGVLAFYNSSTQMLKSVNLLQTGSASAAPYNVGPWTEEFTAGSNTQLTNAAASTGTNDLIFYNPTSGTLTYADVAGSVSPQGTGTVYSINLSPAMPASLNFSGSLGTVPGSTQTFTVTAVDSSGNVLFSDNYTQVTLAAKVIPTGGAFAQVVARAINGTATFTGISVFDVGGTWQLKATSSNVLPAKSTDFTVAAVPELTFAGSPAASIAAGTQPIITINEEDTSGQIVTSDNSTLITLTPVQIGGNNTTYNVTPQAVVSGAATFNDLPNFPTPGTYKYEASAIGFMSTAFYFTVYRLAADSLPSACSLETSNPQRQSTITVDLTDRFGNLEPQDSNTLVTLSLLNSSGTSMLLQTRYDVNGVATFTNVPVTETGTFQFVATTSVPMIGSATSQFFMVNS